jgi:hypothetical protein
MASWYRSAAGMRTREIPLSELKALPVLCVGQADDLRFEDDGVRVWLSRCGVEDGEPYANKVTVETLRRDGRWEIYTTYQARG